VEMVRHDDKGMKKKLPLTVIVEESSLQQFRRGHDLKKTAAFGRHRGHQIRSRFLWCKSHFSRINERPVAKHAAEKLDPEGGGGFNPRITPIKSTGAFRPGGAFSANYAEFLGFSAACSAPEGKFSGSSPSLLTKNRLHGNYPRGSVESGGLPDCRRPAAIAQIGITGDIRTN